MIIEKITEAIQDLVLETKAINQEVATQTIILGSTSLTINNKIHLLAVMAIDSLNYTNKLSLSKTILEIMNQILNNNHHHHNNSNSHNKVLVSIHQVEMTIYNKDNQKPTLFCFVEGDDDYVYAITDFFPLNF